MLYKLARMRQEAPYELPKVCLCANVIGTVLARRSEEEIGAAVTMLKSGVGANWSVTQALQYLSGRQAEFAIELAAPDVRPALFAVHLFAKSACNLGQLGNAAPADSLDLAALRALAIAALEKRSPGLAGA